MASVADQTIEWVRKNEGVFYGDGSAALISALKAKLETLPRIEGKNIEHNEKIADAIVEVLVEACAQQGMRADIEVFKRRENEGTTYPGWRVSWESGPYDWAIQASAVFYEVTGRLAEPYYGFDLSIYDEE